MSSIAEGPQILASDALPILAQLDSRDASVWLLPSFVDAAGPKATAGVLGLPWECVLSETASDDLLKAVDALDSAIEAPLVRRRGLVHVIDVSPSNTLLPPRCLPIFLLNGRTEAHKAGFAAQARRMEMIMELQQRGVRNLVVLGGPDLTLPVELGQLWQDGFQCGLTIVSDDPEARHKITEWQADAGARRVTLLPAPRRCYRKPCIGAIQSAPTTGSSSASGTHKETGTGSTCRDAMIPSIRYWAITNCSPRLIWNT